MYDVRAVRFIKSIDNISAASPSSYVCLGHFHEITIDSLTANLTAQPFSAIQRDRVSGREGEFGLPENRVYSLYILRRVQEREQQALDSFWNGDNSIFTVITRIHCEPCGGQAFQTTSSSLRQFCLEGEKVPHLVSLCQEADQTGAVLALCGAIAGLGSPMELVHCVFYDSLELGDSVAVMKSFSLAAILEIIRYLSTASWVRDTYTYCGISSRLLAAGGEGVPHLPDLPDGARLYGVSSRFSIRDDRQAQQFLSQMTANFLDAAQLQDREFYVTGTADHIIYWGECSEQMLLNIVRYLVNRKEALDGCFNDIITRVGLAAYRPDGGDADSPAAGGAPSSATAGGSTQHPEITVPDWLENMREFPSSPGWAYITRKLLGTLSTMRYNYVMDDLAKLLLPSVHAFMERLNSLHSNKELSGGQYDEAIYHFLNVWASLNNDVTQLESQLTQQPELIPVRYYIPALLLQFELKFLEYCSTALSDSGKRSFHPMLVTTDAVNMYTECPLDPRESEYTGECPLLVFIPIQDLYRPEETAVRATHEMAHYCEDSARSRGKRHDMLAKCVAQHALNMWRRDVAQDLHYTDSSLQDAQAKMLQILTDDILVSAKQNLAIHTTSNGPHLNQSCQAFRYAIYDLEGQARHLERYLLQISPEFFYENRSRYQQIVMSDTWVGIRQGQLQEANCRLDMLSHLCTECYADLAMVLLLEVDFQTYYHSVYEDEYTRLLEEFDIDRRPVHRNIVVHIERMALVIAAMGRAGHNFSWDIKQIEQTPVSRDSWVRMALELLNWAENSESTWDSSIFCDRPEELLPEMLDVHTFRFMLDYLSECVKELHEKLGNSSDMSRRDAITIVRKNRKYISSEAFNWEKIQEFLTQ